MKERRSVVRQWSTRRIERSGSLLGLIALILLMVPALPLFLQQSEMKTATCVVNAVVMNNADSGAGSLRQAILDACDGSTITFADTVASPITLTSAELEIDKNLTIQGPGATLLTISGNNAVRAFVISRDGSAINVTLSGVTIANANTINDGGAIYNGSGGRLVITDSVITGNTGGFPGGGVFHSSRGELDVLNSVISSNRIVGSFGGYGGGICNPFGILVVSNSVLSGNAADSYGGGIYSQDLSTVSVTNSTISGNIAGLGGGIFNGGALTLTGSSIYANNTTGTAGGLPARGGGIFNTSPIAVSFTNSTIAGNSASEGGGIYSNGIGSITSTNSTIARNNAAFASGVFKVDFTGGLGFVNVKNTVIALNGSTVNAEVIGTFVSQGHNLIGVGAGAAGFLNGVNGDQVGSMAAPLDPKLGPLQNNGGPTQTMALLGGSPAIDAGDDSVLGAPLFLTTDQRGPGFPRKVGAHVDIGAFEVQVFNTCLRDNTTGNLLQWDSTTGQYKFTRCSDGFMLTGTGVAKLVNGLRTLTDFKTDRRISAGLNTGQLTGNATIYLMVAEGVWQSFRIVETNPAAVCACT